jgi:hypothetical protein
VKSKRILFSDSEMMNVFSACMAALGKKYSPDEFPFFEFDFGCLEKEGITESSKKALLKFIKKFAESCVMALTIDNLLAHKGKAVKCGMTIQQMLEALDKKLETEAERV